MKILYRQGSEIPLFDAVGIKNCYFKEVSMKKDLKKITKKEHHHTFFEIHIIVSGFRRYNIFGETLEIKKGELIIIPPNIKHTPVSTNVSTHEIAVTFELTKENQIQRFFNVTESYFITKFPKRIEENVKYILEEFKNPVIFGDILIQNCIFEVVMQLMRLYGIKEEYKISHKSNEEDARLSVAKQYIKDNIEFNPQISDVASYCYLSSRQLTRLFEAFENTSLALYIRNQKFEHIAKLLLESDLSLKEISEKMNFSSEYYLNSFFRKIAGIPPGEYRTTMGKKK